MRSLKLLVSLCALSCASLKTQIPDVAVYRELPFSDSPEALEVWTLRDDYRILPTEVWLEMRPYMLMIPPETWTQIKKSWLKACILAGPDCEQEVQSVDNFISGLDSIVKKIIDAQK